MAARKADRRRSTTARRSRLPRAMSRSRGRGIAATRRVGRGYPLWPGNVVRADGGCHVGFCNTYRGSHNLLRRARCCAGTGYNSKRHSSFPRAFNSSHFDGHELHDVVQFAVGKLPNRLPHSAAARARWNFRRSAACTQRDLKLDIEHSVQHWLHFQPTRVPHALLATILPNWKIKRATIRFLRHMAHLPCPSAASRRPGRSRIPIPSPSGNASSSAITTATRSPTPFLFNALETGWACSSADAADADPAGSSRP